MDVHEQIPAAEKQIEITRELRDLPPVHYLFKIENFSLLSDSKFDFYESPNFEVGGYKWKLALHPQGTENVNEIEQKYVSLYLVLSKSNQLPLHWEVNVNFRLFVYNQNEDKYLTVRDAKESVHRFRGTARTWGFEKLLPLNVFNDESNGYLIDDCCMFGAEVFILDPKTRKEECAYLVKGLGDNSYTWRLDNFERMIEEHCESEAFAIGGHEWTLWLYPNGDSTEKGKSLSMYLNLEDSEALNPGDKLNVEFALRVKDQLQGKDHIEYASSDYFSASADNCCWGYRNLMPLSKLNDKSQGFITNGALIVEVEFLLMTLVQDFS